MSSKQQDIRCNCPYDHFNHRPHQCPHKAVTDYWNKPIAGGLCDTCYDIVSDEENNQ